MSKSSGPKVQTLDELSPGQIAAIRSIPPHDEAQAPSIDARRPVSFFFDQEQFELEQRKLFRKLPVPIAVTGMLPERNTVIANDSYGVPVLLARGKDGVVRAFLNACKHKGARLINSTEPQKGNLMVCPYHAWSYGMNGNLAAVSRPETFCNLEKSEYNLTSLPCAEAGGIIWVILDARAAPDFSTIPDELSQDLSAIGIDTGHVYGHKVFELKANWKLILEPFLENYHVQRLHAKTVGPMFADNPTLTSLIGPHIRSVSGRADFTPELAAAEAHNIHKIITHSYRVFPNGVLITSPYYTSFMIIMPKTVSTSTVEYFMLTRGPAETEKARDIYDRSLQLILDVFGKEDFWAAQITQEGLASGALTEVRYSGLEDKIPLYYEIMERYLQR